MLCLNISALCFAKIQKGALTHCIGIVRPDGRLKKISVPLWYSTFIRQSQKSHLHAYIISRARVFVK